MRISRTRRQRGGAEYTYKLAFEVDVDEYDQNNNANYNVNYLSKMTDILNRPSSWKGYLINPQEINIQRSGPLKGLVSWKTNTEYTPKEMDRIITGLQEQMIYMFDSLRLPNIGVGVKVKFVSSISPPVVARPIINLEIPRGTTNAITYDDIQNRNNIVDFNDEKSFGRYYKKNTYDRIMSTTKMNPFTRTIINPSTVVQYKATLKGGKRKTRKAKRTRRV